MSSLLQGASTREQQLIQLLRRGFPASQAMTKEEQLAKYRRLWVKKPHLRSVIILMVEMLDWKSNDYVLKEEKEDRELAKDVKDTLY